MLPEKSQKERLTEGADRILLQISSGRAPSTGWNDLDLWSIVQNTLSEVQKSTANQRQVRTGNEKLNDERKKKRVNI